MGELNDILGRLRGELGELDGAPEPLDGGITNRNFRVTFGAGEYVVRQPGRDTELLGIDRGAERIASEAAAKLGIAPRVATVLDDCLVTEFVTAEAVDEGGLLDHIDELAGALRAMHDSPTLLPGTFRVTRVLADYEAVVRARGDDLPDAYARASAVAERIESAVGRQPPRPCHNDLLPGNLMISSADGRLLIVDWEYAAMGDPRFDLANVSIGNGFDEEADARLLGAYHGREPTTRELAAQQLLRVASDAREAAWAVVQRSVSELDFDFGGYAQEHFARLERTLSERPFERWLATARGEA